MAFPNTSPVCITAAGQLMLARVVMEEMKGNGVRINEVIVQGMVMTRAMAGKDGPEWIKSEEVGDYVSWLASDEAYMVSGSIIHLNQRPPLKASH
ncbi:MAG: hypothetical protein NVS2B14_14590 [Chamaesiphon sp.]